MPLERRLDRWVTAGLITAEEAERIQAFEREDGRPLFLYAIAGLGGLAIAIGLVSIVAANWDGIPGGVKIGVDLAMVAALGYGVWHWERRGPGWAREAAIVVLYGLVLASIALVGQVYQLGGKAHEALATWIGLTALLMTRARSRYVSFSWVIGIQITWATYSVWLADHHDLEAFALSTVYWAPLASMAIARTKWVRRTRPELADVLEAVAWVEIVICATLGTFAFYEDTAREDWTGAYPGGLASALLTAWVMTRISRSAAAIPARALLGGCLVLSHVPLFVSPGDLDLVAALTFIGLWVLIAFAAHRASNPTLLNLATAVIGIRILVVYFEVFGSLLDTGLGLVSGGLLTLGLVWVWVRKRRDFERELAKGGNP